MRLGSVEFFKVLIKTVLLIIFVAPLIVAVIFGVLLVNKNKELEELNKKNTALNIAADVLVGSKSGTAEDFNLIFEKSGISYDDLMKLLFEKGKLDSQSVYNILSNAGVSDKDLLSAAINKNGTDADSLHATLKGAGLTEAEIAAVAELAKKAEQSKPIISTPNSKSTSSSSESESTSTNSEPNSESSSTDSGSESSSNSSSTSSDTSTSTPPEAEYMSKYPDMYVEAPTDYVREKGTVYLTFDDGPSDNVYSVLWILRQRGVKATFFVTPNSNTNVTAKLKAIAADGHTIGIHSATHDYETIYDSVDAFLDDFYEAWNAVYKATGIKTSVFRFPGGSNTDYNVDTRDEIIAEMTRRGFRYYDWNVQSNDILGYTWTQMYNTILNGVHTQNRSIVLFHDRADNGVNVLDDIIKVLLNEGYKFDKINDDTMPYQFIGPFS